MPDKNNPDQESENPLLKTPPPSSPAFEKHYSVQELAALWGLSARTIRRLFACEAGVVEWGQEESRFKRAYKTVRVPESVAQRVYRRYRKAS